jgi:hypothetical protein
MPILSLAAAAAAADAYLRPSPGGRAGTAATFMWLDVPFVLFDDGVCNVAIPGSGLFNCVEGLRAEATGGSGTALDFPLGMLFDR